MSVIWFVTLVQVTGSQHLLDGYGTGYEALQAFCLTPPIGESAPIQIIRFLPS